MTDAHDGVTAGIRQELPKSGMSLRTQGGWLLVFSVIFTLVTGYIIYQEREQLLTSVRQLQWVHVNEEAKLSLYLALTRAILLIDENAENIDDNQIRLRTVEEIDTVLAGLRGMEKVYPAVHNDVLALQESLNALSAPAPKAVFEDVRKNLNKAFLDLEDITNTNLAKEVYWLQQFFRVFDRVSLEWLFFSIVGLMTLSYLVMIFVTRLGVDIRRVQDRAVKVIEGYRGEPMRVTRADELGALMDVINRMQFELRHRETQMELSRQQQFHKEKMAAVGSLAAAVAHEIHNPLSAIMGLTQEMCNAQAQKPGEGDTKCQGYPEMLQAHAKRIMAISRQISEFSTPQSAIPKIFDLNGLIRSTVKFVSFDRRFRSIEPVLSLDSQLPAVYAVSDHVTQVLMNLLFNAADALEGLVDRSPRIEVSTRQEAANVVIVVSDNGAGIDPAILGRVFNEFFTTKPPGKGTGIGLALSKALIDSAGGSIFIESEPGVGATVTVRLPASVIDVDNA